jgi:hypothetical protein
VYPQSDFGCVTFDHDGESNLIQNRHFPDPLVSGVRMQHPPQVLGGPTAPINALPPIPDVSNMDPETFLFREYLFSVCRDALFWIECGACL